MLQFRAKRSQEFYAPGRDILGFFRPINLEVLEILREEEYEKDEVDKLEMLMNAIINESTAGVRGMSMDEIIDKFNETLDDINQEVLNEYTRLLTCAFVFRYVLGKREVPEHQVETESVGKTFGSVFVMSVLPEDLRKKVKDHLLAYNHLHRIVVENEPPCVVEEADDTNG